MAASDNLQPKQLQMFMRPHELKTEMWPGDYEPAFDGPGEEGHRNLWSIKERENWINDMDLRVEISGVLSPVDVVHGEMRHDQAGDLAGARKSGKPVLSNGHHRVQAAAAAERNTGKQYWVPVTHHETGDEVF
jgi:hypothetical protein